MLLHNTTSKEIRYGVLVALDVLAGEAMRTADDETSEFSGDDLDCLVIWRIPSKLLRLEEPSNSRGIITQCEDAVLFAFGYLAFD